MQPATRHHHPHHHERGGGARSAGQPSAGAAADPERCCDRWPPTDRVTDIRGRYLTRLHDLVNHGPTRESVLTYTAWLALALITVILSDQLLLPATTDWAADHGLWGWFVWLLWACTGMAALHETLVQHRGHTYALHVTAAMAVYMTLAAPGEWSRALLAAATAIAAWLITTVAARRLATTKPA